MANQFFAPREIELVEFFGGPPVVRIVDDGYWCYEIVDERGLTLRFSFNLYERSVETALSLGGSNIAVVSYEGADRMLIRDGKLQCEFSTRGAKGALTLEIGGRLSVTWSMLQTE